MKLQSCGNLFGLKVVYTCPSRGVSHCYMTNITVILILLFSVLGYFICIQFSSCFILFFHFMIV